jgi:hypothetical protein
MQVRSAIIKQPKVVNLKKDSYNNMGYPIFGDNKAPHIRCLSMLDFNHNL